MSETPPIQLPRYIEEARDLASLAIQMKATNYCRRPIRLRGTRQAVDARTGELHTVLESAEQVGGALLVPCRNRRATACPACSHTYRGDAWQLIAAGLRGGKGVPSSVAAHPRVFATFTAPSFGPVHSLRTGADGTPRQCRPRRQGACTHGILRSCRAHHLKGDLLLGQPICADCFDYTGAVLWNAHLGQLWQRTMTATRRALARDLGIPVRRLPDVARVSFTKVAEYQARGLVHLHVAIRADGPTPAGSAAITRPPSCLDAALLEQAIRRGAEHVRVPVEPSPTAVKWGNQLDIRRIGGANQEAPGRAEAVAAYISKYATKSTDPLGALDRRIRRAGDIAALHVNDHLRRLVATAWDLGGEPAFASLRLRAWAHTLGYRGHWTTKSRRYSSTFTALRKARAEYRTGDLGTEEGEHILLDDWRYAGRGYSSQGGGVAWTSS